MSDTSYQFRDGPALPPPYLLRSLKLFRKKRGSRRSGPRWAGRLAESLIYGTLIVIGAVGLTWLTGSLLLPDLRAQRELRQFRETQCTVLEKRIDSRHTEQDAERVYEYRPELTIEFQVDDQIVRTRAGDAVGGYSASRRSAERLLQQFKAGQQYPCWYDPAQPSRAVVIRQARWWPWVILVIPISLLWYGSTGLARHLWQSITSLERRDALARRARSFELVVGGAESTGALPAVPSVASVTDSPGLRLAYRLSLEPTASWLSFGMATVCVLWNVVAVALAFQALRLHVVGKPNWLLTCLTAILVLIGVWTVYQLVRQLLATIGVGTTRLEISAHPLYPGQSYDAFLTQTGRQRIRWMRVALACEERAVFQQGTDTRSESCNVIHDVVFRNRQIDIGFDDPFEAQFSFRIPAGAMHSFVSPHNEVNWFLEVGGKVSRWPVFERRFPIYVLPNSRGVDDDSPADDSANIDQVHDGSGNTTAT